jgi:cation:H+ antiporter
VGDGHICIPLCLGLFAVFKPLPMSGFSASALALLGGSALLHVGFLLTWGGLPRWAGGVLVGAYGWFVWAGLLS